MLLRTTQENKNTLAHISFLFSRPTKESFVCFYKFLQDMMSKELIYELLTDRKNDCKEQKKVTIEIEEKECLEMIKRDFGIVNVSVKNTQREVENRVLNMYKRLLDSGINFSRILFKYNVENDLEGARKCFEEELALVKLF